MTTPDQSNSELTGNEQSTCGDGSADLTNPKGLIDQTRKIETAKSTGGAGADKKPKTKPALGRLRTGCKFIKAGLEVAAAIATIFAIIFAYKQFLEAKQDARVSESLAYVARFNSDPVIESYHKIYDAFLATLKPAGGAEPDALTWETNLIVSNKLNWNVIQVGDFFDQLYICISKNICDQELAMTMLKRDIQTAYVLSGKYLRKHWSPTGCGLSALFDLSLQREKHGLPASKLTADACLD